MTQENHPSTGLKYCLMFVIYPVEVIFFYVLLTVHLTTVLAIGQLNAQIRVFLISLLYSSTCFEHCCAHHQEVKIVLYSIW